MCRYPGGEQRRMRWDKLEQVSIMTIDRGPFADDAFWLLTGGETTIVGHARLRSKQGAPPPGCVRLAGLQLLLYSDLLFV